MAVYQRTVLVVEDEPLIRMVLAETLEDEGYRVLEASNVLEAIAALGRHAKVDALITDVDMPGDLDGLDLMRLIASYDSAVTVIVTSGRYSPGEGEMTPGSRFLAKPYRLDDMVSTLQAQLAGRPSLREARLA